MYTTNISVKKIRLNIICSRAIKNIKTPCSAAIETALTQSGMAIMYINKNKVTIGDDLLLKAVKINGNALRHITKQTDEMCLIAVKQKGALLSCVKNKTPEICLAAVKQNPAAASYIKS